jgi:nicotinamide phosphoribosyltransferase
MSMGTKEDELGTFRRLITETYPSGLVSIVSDTWDLWRVIGTYLPILKEEIMKRDGRVVIRPDSGNPADIICGNRQPIPGLEGEDLVWQKGVVESLWDIFGGEVNEKGYKVLDPHIGAIYGDSITLEIADEICRRLENNGFASSNVVFGVGSFTYQYNTRDTYGFAMKATYGEVDGVGREIFKDPVTDNGMKKSLKGLLRVDLSSDGYIVTDRRSWSGAAGGELRPIYRDGELLSRTTIDEIRDRLNA